jgi:hypothetical protein
VYSNHIALTTTDLVSVVPAARITMPAGAGTTGVLRKAPTAQFRAWDKSDVRKPISDARVGVQVVATLVETRLPRITQHVPGIPPRSRPV